MFCNSLQRLASEEAEAEATAPASQPLQMERTDTEQQFGTLDANRGLENNTISLEQASAIVGSEPRPDDLEAVSAEPAGATALVKADALLVAALMGVRLNKNRKKVMTQLSAPSGIPTTPAGSSGANDSRLTTISVPASGEKASRSQKAVSHQPETTNQIEMSTLKVDDIKFDTVSNASSSKNNNTAGTKLNSSNNRAASSSKASKCMLKLNLIT